MGVGRREHLDAASAALDAARRLGRGAMLLFEGEAGIGKTTTLAAIEAEATSRAMRVLSCRAHTLDRARPFGPFLDALPEMHALVSAARAREGRAHRSPMQTVPDDRSAYIEWLAALLDDWSEATPVLVTIDDLHWADAATLAAVARLYRTTDERRVVIVLAFRPLPHDADLEVLLAGLRAEGVSASALGPLGAADVDAIVTDVLGSPPGPQLVEATARAGGNPFLVMELVTSLSRSGRIVERDGVADLAGTVAADLEDTGMRTAILDRMAGVDAETRRLLQAAAVLAPACSVTEVAALLGRSPGELLGAVTSATEAGILADDGQLRFRHDLVREVVESTIGPAALAALHLDAARAMTAAGASPVRIATHYALGAQPGDTEAAQWLRAAAEEIVSTTPTAATDLLDRALAVMPITDPERDALIAELVDATFWGGDVERAADLASAALARPLDPSVGAALHETMARALVVMGRPAEAVAHSEHLVALSEQKGWPTALQAVFRVFALDLEGAAAAARAALEMGAAEAGRDEPDAWIETLASCVLAWEENARGFHSPAVELADRAVRAADRSLNREAHRLIPHLFRGMALESSGRSTEALATLAHGRALADYLGTAWAVPFYHYVSALPHWNAGRWDDVFVECEAGLRSAREHDIGLIAPFACAISATAHLFRCELDVASALIDEGEARLAAGGVQFGADWLVRARALLLEAGGKRAGAFALLRLGWEVAEGLQAAAALVVLGPDLVRLAVDVGDLDVARTATIALERDEVSDARLNIDAHAKRCRGLAGLDVDALLEAQRLHEACERPVEVAQDMEALVVTLLRVGRRDEAARELTTCVAYCDHLDMPLVAERVRQAAARLGLTQPRRRPARGTTGWASLTETERLVAGLVAAGRTNPQVAAELLISRRTVESHLYRIFFKLGVTNRTELAVAAIQQR